MHEVIDCSNYQRQFSRADADAVKAAGVEAVVIGRQRANRQYEAAEAAAALDAGLRIVGEYWINVGDWPRPLPESKFIAVDVEPGSEFTDEASIDAALAQIAGTGRIPVIYTSGWAWDSLGLTNLTKYGESGVLLWDANYDGRADGYVLPRAFGGWSDCVIDQYTEHGDFGLGYELDRDAISDEFWNRCYQSEPQQEPAWAVAAASTQSNQEADVQTRPLDQGESIAAINAAAASLGSALNDDGVTVVEITGGLPDEVTKYLPAGGHAYLFTTKG